MAVSLQTLWAGIRQRDSQSLTNLYRQVYTDLLNFGMYFGHDAHTTKDTINQIFLEIWEKGETLMPVDNVRSYLITYLRRKLIREYEYGNRQTELTGLEPATERSYEDVIISQQQDEHVRARLRAALTQLTPRQNELIQMRFFEGLSNEAISRATGMHVNTVYNTMSAALKTLRQTLTQEEYYTLLAQWPFWLGLGASAELLIL
ncbi:hypothetical protein AWR27_12140 [Spirosoma montaniterrae]|uniref:RNA polymerase sigma factor 70 region 4 type 2 domain-containing protein n=2 Tax=Spirosoma montaniterrae TaxID=1178516 RepID=A0A1P9WX89_9BACT|nr:hypothetical protein AWR27_12140 [Spirosoma montaniterrae]